MTKRFQSPKLRLRSLIRWHWMACRFTLIELLVVIAIILILVAMLMPSLEKARMSAMLTVTAANAKTLNTAMGTYGADNDRRLPPGRLNSTYNYMGWDDFIDPYVGNGLSYADKINESPTERGYFEVYACPMDTMPRTIGNGIVRTFATNGFAAGASPRLFSYNDNVAAAGSMRLTALSAPSTTIMLAEQAKNYNPVGHGGNTLILGSGYNVNIPEVTYGIVLSGTVQYNSNHHENNHRNILAYCDGHVVLEDMRNTILNSYSDWRTIK